LLIWKPRLLRRLGGRGREQAAAAARRKRKEAGCCGGKEGKAVTSKERKRASCG
jgi:hypothetical protein